MFSRDETEVASTALLQPLPVRTGRLRLSDPYWSTSRPCQHVFGQVHKNREYVFHIFRFWLQNVLLLSEHLLPHVSLVDRLHVLRKTTSRLFSIQKDSTEDAVGCGVHYILPLPGPFFIAIFSLFLLRQEWIEMWGVCGAPRGLLEFAHIRIYVYADVWFSFRGSTCWQFLSSTKNPDNSERY